MMRLERVGIIMTELRQIHDFAIKWADKFRDPSLDPIVVGNHAMANDCARLGFKWEDAHVFSEKYGQAMIIRLWIKSLMISQILPYLGL